MRTILLLLLSGIWALSSCVNSTENDSYTNPDLPVEQRVADLLEQMTLEEKVGQMTQIERGVVEITTIRDYKIGSVLNGGGSSPGDSPVEWANMYDSFQQQALETRLGIPMIYGTDAVHGHSNVKSAVIFPHNIGMGCTRNPDLMEEVARITALEVAATGIDWTFAPAIPVTRDERWGRTYESFGETAELAEMFGAASVKGYQGDNLANTATIAACAKHWIGDGGTSGGQDRGNTLTDEETLRALHMPGYVRALEEGVATVMVSYSSWNGEKMHGQAYLISEVLKNELGFDGFVISDWFGIDELPGDYTSDVEGAINAGIDMVMVPFDYEKFITTLISLVQQGRVSEDRINDAVSRILKVKFELGLFEEPLTNRELLSQIGIQAHRDVGRQAVRESLVLLKNENSTLPLSKSMNIHFAGKNADDLGLQMGGWSIYWQGGSGDITTGTSILEGFEELTTTGNITYSRTGLGTAANNADVVVAVIGENPYAEGAGDDQDLSIFNEDLAVIENLKNTGKPLIVILISGRPMILENVLDDADALVAAWLPGTEGAGVAEVLYGDYAPTGKLSLSWPRFNAQIPINVGDANYDPLFEYGFGLTYN